MGITERHWFEDEEPELTERQLQDAVEERVMARTDIPETATIKIKPRIHISATRCLACGTWECPNFNHELYEAVITGETTGLCESCRKAILWAKEHMNDSN